jgi:hypothetical protein
LIEMSVCFEFLRLLVGIVGDGELDVDTLLEQRGDDHEDDEKDEAHVHERRDVDVALELVPAACAAHAHWKFLLWSSTRPWPPSRGA